jgi:hypothetical protein
LSIPEHGIAQENRLLISIVIGVGVLSLCLCILVIGTMGSGIALTNSWAAATKQEQIERTTAVYQEQYAQSTAQVNKIYDMVPDGIAERFPRVFFYEPFDSVGGWTVGKSDNEYWAGEKSVSACYIWSIDSAKNNFLAWEPLPSVGDEKDFYFQVYARLVEGSAVNSCYGISFRRTSTDNYYLLAVCERSFYVGYIKDGIWNTISDWQKKWSLHLFDTNQLGVSADAADIDIFINNEKVYSFTGDYQQGGRFGIVVQKFDKSFAKYKFDNIVIFKK